MSPSELDKLWREAMASAAAKAMGVANELQNPCGPAAQGFRMLASEIRQARRPSGWGERKDDE